MYVIYRDIKYTRKLIKCINRTFKPKQGKQNKNNK